MSYNYRKPNTTSYIKPPPLNLEPDPKPQIPIPIPRMPQSPDPDLSTPPPQALQDKYAQIENTGKAIQAGGCGCMIITSALFFLLVLAQLTISFFTGAK